MKKEIFRGSGVAIVTPMFKDDSINYEKLAELIEFQIKNSTDSIVICGTTGESATMTDQEHLDCIEFAVKQANKRVCVVAGAGSNDTAYAVDISKESKKLGADALLHVTPYYNKASQRGLIKHFEKCAEATDLPIILYNVPSRTGVNITTSTYKILADHPNIVATKEASGNISAIAELISVCGDKLAVYSGNDDQIVPIMALGGIGVISVVANVMPQETHDICKFFLDGDIEKSRALQLKMLKFINSLFIDVNPIPVKEALNIMGYDVGECRLPLCNMADEQINTLKNAMLELNLI